MLFDISCSGHYQQFIRSLFYGLHLINFNRIRGQFGWYTPMYIDRDNQPNNTY